MRLKHLHIDNYKMFNNFDIDFLDKNNEPLPIIVLAGLNGSGKSSLLEFISQNRQLDNIIYFLAGIDSIAKVADEFVKTFYFFLKERDYRPSEITEHFDNYLKEIFNDLDIGFRYSHLDKDDNVWFSNNDNTNQEYYYNNKDGRDTNLFTIDNLSTGEKTLLSKVLYLYFQDYKDKIILIDEPELSLHPSWQNRVLKIYENFALANNCQIIIATHSPHIIGSAKPEYLRALIKVGNKIEVSKYTQSYGLEFSQILTDIMEIEYLRTPTVAKKMNSIKEMIIKDEYDTNIFKSQWSELEELLGKSYLDLKLLKLEIASRKKNVSNN